MTMNAGEPVMFLQWLDDGELNEAHEVYADYCASFDILYAEATSSEDARQRVQAWLAGNDHAQVLYIGTHGEEGGIGPREQPLVPWKDMHDWLDNQHDLTLWLGACKSSFAADGLSPVDPGQKRVDVIFGFEADAGTDEIKTVLQHLAKSLSQMRTDSWKTELEKIRFQLPGTSLKAFELGPDAGQILYVDVDRT